ncbi:MAG TPA: hypothetical protein VLE22_21735 [Bryobacteraceae bacterium]|nr:hypothetical protein [Bryobacteraceae bacterium]
MRNRAWLPLLCLICASPAACGPVEFGRIEVERAIAERGLKPSQVRFTAEITPDAPETYRIEPGRITGGDLRGLMYGLLEAAAQIRERGRLFAVKGAPATPMRGIRWFLHNADLERDWYYSHEYWRDFFAMLARNRFNRFNLVFAHQTEYLAPPYPYWVELPEFRNVRAPGLSSAERDRNLEMLRFISHTAAEHGVDFTLGIWEHNIQPGMEPSVEGLTAENIGPYSYAALKKVLAACPAIRSVQMRTNSESGIPSDKQVEFYRDWVFRAVAEAGRRVTLDMRGWAMQPGMLDAAVTSGAPLRLSSKYWAEDLGRPYQPAETWPGYSYLDFLKKPRPYEFYWEVWGLGSNRLLLWGDPDFVRRMTPTFRLSDSIGFEIDPPMAQKGFGNRPGKWGVFAAGRENRIFWKHEFERYWLFYLLWGRLSYDPKTPDSAWMAELKRRFGTAAADVLEAYRGASGVLPEIVAAHLADPNMYIWPEINPGGLIDAYKDVRPSDWRMIAGIPEAVRNRIEGMVSAKQTALDTAQRLDELAARTEQAVARARSRLRGEHREWSGSEPDFSVLSSLARYHARKQTAAYRLEWFYQTGDPAALADAKRELSAAAEVWEGLARLTDGLYPEEMAFGPDDVGHWKHKLAYVRHDLKIVEEREKVLERFGQFEFGFDFGGPVTRPHGSSYRNDPYVWMNTVEPRFLPVDPGTAYSEERGYGWATEGEREAVAARLATYHEVRAVVTKPGPLPHDALTGDSIRGSGRQVFRVRTASNGERQVLFLNAGGEVSEVSGTATNGVLDIAFPEGEWNVSGLVVKVPGAAPKFPVLTAPKPMPRPVFTHIPPHMFVPGRPLSVALGRTASASVKSVRLHYRPLNQLAKFKTLEAAPGRAVFTIPPEDLTPDFDLLYYFEVLDKQGGGWFHPDPRTATPYYVVTAAKPGSSGVHSVGDR